MNFWLLILTFNTDAKSFVVVLSQKHWMLLGLNTQTWVMTVTEGCQREKEIDSIKALSDPCMMDEAIFKRNHIMF